MGRSRAAPVQDLWLTATHLSSLKSSWARVLANHGAAGGDGIGVEAFAATVAARLTRLSAELRQGQWRPGRARAVDIPKRKGGTRRLMIPPVADRVVAGAVALVLSPVLEAQFSDASFAYRPGRGVQDALAAVARWRDLGFVHVVEADIVSFFDRLSHDRLLAKLDTALQGQTGAARLIDLIALMLDAHALETGIAGRGVPQGSPLSPLLSNLYLDALDDALDGRGLRIVRYADDFVILSKDREGAEAALARAKAVLADEGLELHADGSRVWDFDRGFDFLGEMFVKSLQLPSADGPEEEATEALRRIAERDRAGAAEDEAEERAGYDRGARVLYLLEPGRRLELDGGTLAVMAAEGHRLAGIAPSRVGRIEIGPGCTADWDVLAEVAGRGIPLALTGADGETRALWAAPDEGRAALHLAQARAVLDPGLSVALARRLVEARLRSMRTQLFRLNREAKDAEVTAALAGLLRMVQKLETYPDIPALRGAEGHAAALYWPALGKLTAGAARPLRRQRPARDPVNAAVNYLTGVLQRDMQAAVAGAGLHVGFGLLHPAQDGNQGLVWDLMEPFRAPLTEGLAAFLFNARRLRPDMFDAGRIAPEGRQALIAGYEAAVARRVAVPGLQATKAAWRPIMRRQALSLAAAVRDADAALFMPFEMAA